MNITNLTNSRFTTRAFALITIVAMLLSAFPVAFFVVQADTGINADSFTIDLTNPEYTASADTTGLEI